MTEFVRAENREYPLRNKGSGEEGLKYVRLTVGSDCRTGRQLQREFTGRTAEEIQRKIDSAMKLGDGELGLTAEEIPLERLAKDYLNLKGLWVSEVTRKDQEGYFRNRIQPYFRDRTARSIRPEEIEDWQERLRREGRRENYISNGFMFMNQIMEYGMEKGYLHYNPCRYAGNSLKEHRDQRILSRDQLRKLLVEEKDHPMASLFAVTLLLGLRVGETLGLTWREVNWEKGTVRICRQGEDGGKLIPRTKTGRVRTLRMPAYTLAYLRREKERQERLAEGNPLWDNPEGLVFTDDRGRMRGKSSVQKTFAEMMRGTGEPVTLHSLRRTAASVLAEKVSMHAAQYYLGHSDGRTTLKYVYPEMKDEEHMVQVMGKVFDGLLREAGW